LKDQLHSLFETAIAQLKTDEILPAEHSVQIQFERTRQKDHGDFATNVAMTLAKPARRNPRELAELIFINLFLAQDARYSVLSTVFEQGDAYGLGTPNSKQKIMVEFVSANPTGPLHVGHGRGAAYGDALARVLSAAGNTVEREYYVNDAGRQMDILAVSVWIRYLQANEVAIELPGNCYKGEYVVDYAQKLAEQHTDHYVVSLEQYEQARHKQTDSQALLEFANLSAQAREQAQKAGGLSPQELELKYQKKYLEEAVDVLIDYAKNTLGKEGFSIFFDQALTLTLDDIREDLGEFGVKYDTWFSERSLFDDGKIQRVIDKLKASGDVYDKGGALWFKTTDYGDEKDRVVIRENGQPTYFASDIAYHADKLERGFDLTIDVWGSDHHGYIPRVKASLEALGLDPAGEFVTLRELREEVGSDAARFFYAQRKSEQHMDFDLDLAKSQNNENPMYYVQYAHARICRIFDTAIEREIDTSNIQSAEFSHLNSDHEVSLLTLLQRFPEVVQSAANSYEPHQITYYLRDLATAFHSYYNTVKFLEAGAGQRDAMLALSRASQQVLKNGLNILGVGAPTSM